MKSVPAPWWIPPKINKTGLQPVSMTGHETGPASAQVK